MTHTLELVKAGAGAGKTYDLCEYVCNCIESGVDPAKILATTFTRKAAAELKGRVQEKLRLLPGKPGAPFWFSDRFELALVGTVHSIAHQLLSRFAIEMGLSPELDVLMDEESQRVLSEIVGRLVSSNSTIFGGAAKRMGIDRPEELILEVYDSARGNRIDNTSLVEHLSQSAARLCEILHDNEIISPHEFQEEFEALVQRTRDDIGSLQDDNTNVTAEGMRKLDDLLSAKYCEWGRVAAAMRIKAGKTSGADGMLDPLRQYASQLCHLSTLHDDIREFTAVLGSLTGEVGDTYQQYKLDRGLVDYYDLELKFLDLLEREDLADELKEEFSVVLVDEFQDTNPLQLMIFNKLRGLASKSRWVGDAKQAIYGFRSSDPQLINRVWGLNKDCSASSLPNNWRSQKGLVQFVGRLFSPIFGEEANQVPQKAAENEGVERWLLDTTNIENDAFAILAGLETLHQEGISYRDIAVVARDNNFLSKLASAFDDFNVPYLLERSGLMVTREVALIMNGLCLVSDRHDSLAAASIKHSYSSLTDHTPAWITERLEHLKRLKELGDDAEYDDKKPWPDDVMFGELESVDNRSLSPTVIIQQVIQVLNVYSFIATWDDPVGRMANVDSLVKHAQLYEELMLNSSRAATLAGFIRYMSTLADNDEDICFPALGHDAVTLITYHGTKGLEWPVVVLTQLDKVYPSKMFSPQVIGGGEDEQDALDGRTLRVWTWPFGEIRTYGGRWDKVTGSNLENTVLGTPEGLEQQAAQDAESVRLLYVGATRAKSKLVFAHRAGKTRWLDQVEAVTEIIPHDLEIGEHELNGIDTTIIVREFDDGDIGQILTEAVERQYWISSEESDARESNRKFYSPSEMEDKQASASFSVHEMNGSVKINVDLKEDQHVKFGNAVHSFFGALPNISHMENEHQISTAEQCLSGYRLSNTLAPETLLQLGERLQQWVKSKYPGAIWHTELPATANRTDGGQWRGIMDLVLELEDGKVVVIDHKTGQVGLSKAESYASQYKPQLDAYREMLEGNGINVDSLWIHLPMTGLMVKLSESN